MQQARMKCTDIAKGMIMATSTISIVLWKWKNGTNLFRQMTRLLKLARILGKLVWWKVYERYAWKYLALTFKSSQTFVMVWEWFGVPSMILRSFF